MVLKHIKVIAVMGRGKLIPFLKESLAKKAFPNLTAEPDDSERFSVEFTRFEKEKPLMGHENILKAWCAIRNLRYSSFSQARGVLLSALNNSAYLIPEPNRNKKFCYRFATQEEIKEKKQKKRQKSKLKIKDPLLESSNLSPNFLLQTSSPPSTESILPAQESPLPSPDPPPSNSSGYQSMGEEFDEEFQTAEENTSEDLHFLLSMCLKDLDKNTFDDIIAENDGFVSFEDINKDELLPLIPETQPPVEINAANQSALLETFWLCTQKVALDNAFILICEKQVMQDENQGLSADQIVIPNTIWEPGESYSLQKAFELNGKYFLFFIPNN